MAVGSVVNAIAILRHLAVSEPQGVNAIARSVALSPSSCFNILKTLVQEDFVDFDAASKNYRIGTAPARLFAGAPNLLEWTSWVQTELEKVARDFSLSTGLWQVRANRVVLSEVAECPDATRIHLSLGQRLPSHIGAMGRCIAARERMTREQVAEAIAALTWQNPPAVEDFWRDMQLADERGWAMDEGNYLRGVTTLAAPIADGQGQVRYCVTSTLFSGQYDAVVLEQIGARTARLAAEAEWKLLDR